LAFCIIAVADQAFIGETLFKDFEHRNLGIMLGYYAALRQWNGHAERA
jgi:hypothetical protein